MAQATAIFGGGGLVPKSIVNAHSAGTIVRGPITTNGLYPGYTNVKRYATGNTTAGTLKTILSVSGSGALELLCLENTDVTARTERIKITLDGVAVFDATAASPSQTGSLTDIVGSILRAYNGTYFLAQGHMGVQLQFNTSLLIEYASSLTESPCASNLGIIYYTR